MVASQELHAIAREINLGIENFEQFIDTLNTQNILLVRFALASRLVDSDAAIRSPA